MKNLAKNITTAAWNKGYKRSQVEKMVGVSGGYISRLEHDKLDPRISTIIKISELVGVPIDTLVNGKVESTRESEKLSRLKAKRKAIEKEIERLEGEEK